MEATSLAALFADPSALRLTAQRPAALLLALALPVFFFPARHASRLRAASFLALVGALAGLRLTTSLPSERLALVVAVDLSDSVGEPAREWAERLTGEVARGLVPGDEIAVLTFAGDTRLARPWAPANRAEPLPDPPAREATHLGRAVQGALALYPPGKQRRLLLLTDGNETRGDVLGALPLLQNESVRVDAAVPPRDPRPDVRLDKLVAPALVSDDTIVPIRVVVRNQGGPRPAVLKLFLDGLIIESAAVQLREGLNSFDLPSRLTGQGAHLLGAELSVPDDAAPGNNRREASLTVGGPTRVLIAAPGARSALSPLLQRRGFAVEVRALEQLPAVAESLPNYQGVVVEDGTAGRMSARSLDALERYVREFGGGLVFAGGSDSFADASFTRTALDRLLPLTLEPNRPRPGAREPLALFLLIDRSNSMGYNSRNRTLRDGEKLRFARQAALAVVRQLEDRDLIGVIAFDAEPHPIAALAPVRQNRPRLEDLLPRLVENGGTDFYDSLESARTQLAAARVSRRHVILLTDGDTNRSDPEEYEGIVGQIARDGISVSTIRVGENTVNLELLQQISRRTGGEFHHVADARMLPALLLDETSRAEGPAPAEAPRFFPRLGRRSQILRGIDERGIPSLDGYAYTRAKPGADTPLYVTRLERRDPLLATWQYGLGRVAAFAASPASDTRPWTAWADSTRFWSQLVRWTSRAEAADEVAVAVEKRDGNVLLTVRSYDPRAEVTLLVARLGLGQGETHEAKLTPGGAQLFHASLGDLTGGRYPLTLVGRRGGGEVFEQTLPVTIPAHDQEPPEEHRHLEPNVGLLKRLTAATGGSLDPRPRDILRRAPGREQTHRRLDGILVPLAMCLFLADVALRRGHLAGRG